MDDDIHHSTHAKGLGVGRKINKREGKGQRLNYNIFSIAKSLLLYNKYTALYFGLPAVNYFLRIKLKLSGRRVIVSRV